MESMAAHQALNASALLSFQWLKIVSEGAMALRSMPAAMSEPLYGIVGINQSESRGEMGNKGFETRCRKGEKEEVCDDMQPSDRINSTHQG